MARIHADQGDFNKAESYAQFAITNAEIDLEKSDAYSTLAYIEAQRFNFESSYQNYRKAIDLNPKNVNALNNITTVLDKVNRSNEKVGYYQEVLEADSTFYLVHINIGFHYLSTKEFDLALKEFDAVLAKEPNQAIALSNKAYALMKLGQLTDALLTIDKSIQWNPTNSYAYRNKALILLELKNTAAACGAINEALRLNFTQQYGEEVLVMKKKNCE